MRSFDVKSGENEEHSGGPQPLLFGIYFSPNLKRRIKVFLGGNWYSMVDLHTLMLLLLLPEALPYNAIGAGAKFPPGSLISHAVN